MSFFTNLVSYWATGESADSLQRTSDQADARLHELNVQKRDQYAEDYGDDFAADWYGQAEQHLAQQKQDVAASIDAGAREGLQEGWHNVTSTVGSVPKLIPGWLYVAAAVAAAIYFWPVLRVMFAKRR